MRKCLPGKIVCLFCFLYAGGVSAQSTSSDSSLLNASLRRIVDFHNQVLGENIHLYNGPQNTGYNHLSVGQPYFMADSVQVGSVFYDGILYRGVRMLYDLVQDNVVIVRYSNNKEMSEEYKNILRMDLIRDQVSWFNLPGHEFMKLDRDSSTRNMAGGFYDRVIDGNIKLFIRREKRYVEDIKGTELERRFELHNYYYIKKAGVFYRLKSKKSVLQLFKDKKKELSAFTKKNKIKFKKNQENFIIEVSRYYDTLIK